MGMIRELNPDTIERWSAALRHVAITITVWLIPIAVIVLLVTGQPEAAFASVFGRIATLWSK